jgi:hypothetical protein
MLKSGLVTFYGTITVKCISKTATLKQKKRIPTSFKGQAVFFSQDPRPTDHSRPGCHFGFAVAHAAQANP